MRQLELQLIGCKTNVFINMLNNSHPSHRIIPSPGTLWLSIFLEELTAYHMKYRYPDCGIPETFHA